MNGRPRRILVVDDSPEKRALLNDVLTLNGFEVSLAENGKNGFQASQDSLPDLVLMDLNLPDMPGVDVCRMIRSSPKTQDVPIMIVTGAQPSSRDKVWGFRSGADDYLAAPFELEELMERIQAIFRRLEKREGPREAAFPEPAREPSPLPAGEDREVPPEPPAWPARAWTLSRGLALDPIATLGSAQETDLSPAYALLACTVLLDACASLPTSFGSWTASSALSALSVGLPWLALSSAAFLAMPFFGLDASWRKTAVVTALAGAPRAIGAALALAYALSAAWFPAVEFRAFSSGFDLFAPGPPQGIWRWLSRISLFDAWSAAWTVAGLIALGGVRRETRLPFALFIGALSLLLGAFAGR